MESIEIKRFLDMDDHIGQAYQSLRKNIRLYGPEMKIIGFTGCNQDDEISSVILNMAAVLAKESKKISVIISYIDRLSISSMVLDQQVEDLSCLTSTDTTAENIYQTDIENLYIVLYDAALSNASETAGMKKLSTLIQELNKACHYVLVDIPSLDAFGVTETLKVCDGIVLAVKANTVSFKSARKAKMKLELSGCPILGAVLLQDA